MNRRKKLNVAEMTPAQHHCYCMLCDILGGAHHIYGKIHEATPSGIEAVLRITSWSTWDSDRLTKAVLFAHDRAIRIEICPCNFNRLTIYLHKRGRGGGFSERHPTIQKAIERLEDKS